MNTKFEFNAGDWAPSSRKAIDGENLCFVCSRKLGKNPFHYEMSTGLVLIVPGSDAKNSQGGFPVGSECAKKFAPGLLVKFGA